MTEKTQIKEKEAPPVLDLRMERPGHWGLPVRYQAPPRFLAVSLVAAFVGLTAIGPSIFSVEAMTGLLRQVMAIARVVHLAEQLRESPTAPVEPAVISAPLPPVPEQAVRPQRFALYTGPDPNRPLQMEVDAAEQIVDLAIRKPNLVDIATATSAREFLASMPKCVPGRAEFLQRPLVPPGMGPGFAN